MGDEEELDQRTKEMIKDKIAQARWYESLHLYAEALRIYESVRDEENIDRLKGTMAKEYRTKAKEFEASGKLQEAANLFYIIGDKEALDRIKARMPDVVIFYDREAGGISQLAGNIDAVLPEDVESYRFRSPNAPRDEEDQMDKAETDHKEKKKLPVKMPRGKPTIRYCPYCGESLITKKDPKFCPFCGEEL